MSCLGSLQIVLTGENELRELGLHVVVYSQEILDAVHACASVSL